MKYDTVIIGGGVIGSSIAYQLARKGQKVIVLERGQLAGEASAAAAGMLGAQSEMESDGPLFELARLSRAMFPQLAEQLKELTGIDIGYVNEGLLHLAMSDGQEQELRARGLWQRKAGEQAEWLDAEEVYRMEPALRKELRGALYLPKDGQVQAPLLAQAFASAATIFGAEFREYVEVAELVVERGEVVGVRIAEGVVYADRVVVAAGAWSGELLRSVGVGLPIYPVKGECFSVLVEEPLLRRSIFSQGCYLVPKAGGRIVIGATMQAHTYDRRVSVEGIALLMERAVRLVPQLVEAEWERCWSGLRPQTEGGLPYLGKLPHFGELYIAAGHYRNGILLSPVTGVCIAEMILGGGDGVLKASPIGDADYMAAEKLNLEAFCPNQRVMNGLLGKELSLHEIKH